MNQYLGFIWTNTSHAVLLVVKWFIIALIARIAMVIGVLFMLLIPAFVFGFADGFGMPIFMSVILGILGFIAGATAFGAIASRFGPMMSLDFEGSAPESKSG